MTETTPTLMSSPNSVASVSPHVEQLHKVAPPSKLEEQRRILQEKLAVQQNEANFISPTDQMMTPCSKKLADAKTKGIRPAKLSARGGLFAKTNKPRKTQTEKTSKQAAPAPAPASEEEGTTA